jgi:hypothetical protein
MQWEGGVEADGEGDDEEDGDDEYDDDAADQSEGEYLSAPKDDE